VAGSGMSRAGFEPAPAKELSRLPMTDIRRLPEIKSNLQALLPFWFS
jgi:hypothetical protein